jgi:Ca2+-binding EF-hand superfamily protein
MNINDNEEDNNEKKYTSENEKSFEEENKSEINEEEKNSENNNNNDNNEEEEEEHTINNSDSIEIENNSNKNNTSSNQNKSVHNENFNDSQLSVSKISNNNIKEIEKEIINDINVLDKLDNKIENDSNKNSKENNEIKEENSINSNHNNSSIKNVSKISKTSEENFSKISVSNKSYEKEKKNSIVKKEKEDYYKKAEMYYKSLSADEKKKLSNIVTYIKGQNHQLNEEELNEIFKKLDVHEREKINFEDLQKFLSVLRTNVNNYYINEIIKEYGDDNNEITQKMFIKKMNENIKGKYKKDDITELKEIFQLFDTNHDNKISYEDIKNVMNALGETTFNDDMCKEMIRHLKLKANINNLAINKENCYLNYDDFIEIVKGESEQ